VRTRTRLSLLALALALLIPAIARADPKDDARRHFVAGLEAAKEGQYEVALQHFLAAQDAYPHPSTLFNIARSYYDLGDLENSLTYFRLFQDAAPDKAADVAPTIAVIEAKIHQETGQVATPAPAPTGGGAGAATPEELARLQGIADELSALTKALEQRKAVPPAPAPAPAPAGPEGAQTAPAPATATPPAAQGDFLSDAYQRVVVTASRYGQEPLDSPSTVTIITADDIRMSGATSIPDVLRRVVGVDVMQLASGQSEVSIRGFNRELSNKVLILVDGRSTYLDFMGTTIWETIPITLDEIERIEVIRGPGSAVYGANAVTGVINIITRTPGEGKNHVLVDAGYPDYLRGTMLATGRAKGIGYRFSAGYKQAARWGQDFSMADHSAAVPLFPSQDHENLGLQKIVGTGRIEGTFLNKGYASLSGGFSNGTYEFYNIGALDDFGIRDTHTYLRGDVAWGPVHLRAFWNAEKGYVAPWYKLYGDPRTLATPLNADTVDVEAEANGNFSTGAVKHHLNGGLSYRYKRLADFIYAGEEPGSPPIQENHYAGFLSEDATWEWLKVVGTMRVDVHPNLPVSKTLSPRGAAIFRVAPQSSLRIAGGSAFRAPNMVENYMDFQLGSGVDGVYIQDYGDVNLLPERIVTAEVGFHDESTLYHTADIAVYYNRLTNVIALGDVTPRPGPFNPQENGYQAGTTGWINTNDAYSGVGVEGDVDFFPVDGLDVYGNFAYTFITEASTGQDTSTSPFKVNAGAQYRTPWYTDLSLSVSWYSAETWPLRVFDADGQVVTFPQDVPARTLLTARVAVRPLKTDKLEIAGSVWNATAFAKPKGQWGFQEHPKGQLVGPRVYGTVAYRF